MLMTPVFDIARAASLVEGADLEYGYEENIDVVAGSLSEGVIYITGRGNYTGLQRVQPDN